MMDSEHWLKVWRGLAYGLLRDGYYSADAVLHWAKENGFPLVHRCNSSIGYKRETFEAIGLLRNSRYKLFS